MKKSEREKIHRIYYDLLLEVSDIREEINCLDSSSPEFSSLFFDLQIIHAKLEVVEKIIFYTRNL